MAYTDLTSLLKAIANAIRSKKGTINNINAQNFPNEISSIKVGITPSGTKSITSNGTYDVTYYANANVDVHEITYIYKNGNWNSDFPYQLTEGRISPNGDGSFTFIGTPRGRILFNTLPVGKTLFVKFKSNGNNVNQLHLIKDNVYRAYMSDDINSSGTFFRTIGMQINGATYIYIAGNDFSYIIYEIFII